MLFKDYVAGLQKMIDDDKTVGELETVFLSSHDIDSNEYGFEVVEATGVSIGNFDNGYEFTSNYSDHSKVINAVCI